MIHPSLKEDFLAPPPLEPKRVMPVNEKCWCGSGKKWKKCHRNRDKQSPVPHGQLMARQRSEIVKGYCLHPKASDKSCSQNIVRAHTVQRRGGLLAIAEKGHVISAKKGFEDIFKNEGRIIPRELGIKDASTFMGFCDFHDNQMFEPIEKKPLTLSHEAAFLLSFRAISYEYFTKDTGLRINKLQQELDKGRSFEDQCVIQTKLYWLREGMKRGMSELNNWKLDYDNAYKSQDYSRFSFYSIRFSGLLPVVACGAFQPEFDLNGNQLQIISRGKAPFEHVSFNLTSVDDKSIMTLGWIGENGGPAKMFFDSFKHLEDNKKSNAAIYLAFEHLENIYFQPSWWETCQDHVIKELVTRMRSGLGFSGPERTGKSLTDFPYILSDFSIEEEISA